MAKHAQLFEPRQASIAGMKLAARLAVMRAASSALAPHVAAVGGGGSRSGECIGA